MIYLIADPSTKDADTQSYVYIYSFFVVIVVVILRWILLHLHFVFSFIYQFYEWILRGIFRLNILICGLFFWFDRL